MGLMDLINQQRKDEKRTVSRVTTEILYPTGLLPLDYANGMKVISYDEHDRPVASNELIGIVGGTMNTIIGITGTGKSALAVEISASGIHQFGDMSMVQHADIERASSMQRVLKVLQLKPSLLKRTYDMFRDTSAEDIIEAFMDQCNMKINNEKEFTYNTGIRDIYNDEITEFYPSSLLIDSFALFKTGDIDIGKGSKKGGVDVQSNLKDATNNMQAAQSAKFNKGVLSQLLPYGKKSNTSINCVNHINTNVNTGFLPKPSQQMYLTQDETLPGGQASLYLANNIIKLRLLAKYDIAKPDKWEYGIPGFVVDARFLKSRTNASNIPVELVFDQRRGGFSKTLTLIHYAFKNELFLGTNRAYYVPGLEGTKFTKKTWEDAVNKDPDFLEALYEACLPSLRSMLSTDTGRGEKEESDSEKFDAMYSAIEEHERDVAGYKKQGWVDFE